MTYAIIGSGTVGTTLARLFARKNIPVSIANSRGPDTLSGLAAELGSSVSPVPVGGKLVKAFNQLPLKTLAAPIPDDIGKRVVFVSSDHEDASAEVAKLVEELGFAAIEVGKLAEGGRLIQARAPLVFQNLIKYPM